MRLASARRRFAPLLVGALVGAVCSLAWMPSGVAQVGDDDAPPPIVDSLRRCVELTGSVDVLMLVDNSRSLNTSDGDGQRFAGLRAALSALQQEAGRRQGDELAEVNVAFATFDAEYAPRPGGDEGVAWQRVTVDSAEQLDGFVAELERQEQRGGTDYDAALAGARADLAERAAERTEDGGAAPCQALIFFTDGGYQPAGGGDTDRLQEDLCRPGGPPDALHRDDVHLFTVALAGDDTDDPLDQDALDFLEALTVGDGPWGQCGTSGSPDLGSVTIADNPAQLYVYLATIFTDPLVFDGSGSFEIDEAVRSFAINLTRLDPTWEVRLDPPSGSPVTLDPQGPSELDVGGTRVRQDWFGETQALVVAPDLGPASHGTWSLTFVVPEGIDTEELWALDLESAVSPRLVEPSPRRVTRGESTELEVEVVDERSGDVVDIDAGSRLRAEVRTRGRSVQTIDLAPDGRGLWRGDLEVPLDEPASTLELVLRLEIDRNGDDPLLARPVVYRLGVQLPGGGPTIEPDRLELGSVSGVGDTTGTLTVIGGSDPACVWVQGWDEGQPPEEAGRIDYQVLDDGASEGDCVRVDAEGQERALTVRFDNEQEASGQVDGVLTLLVKNERTDQVIPVEIPVEFSLTPEVNEPIWWLVFLAMVLIGLGAPLLLLYFLNRWGAEFESPHLVLVSTQTVRVTTEGDIQLLDGDRVLPFQPTYREFEPAGLPGRTAEIPLTGAELRAKAVGGFGKSFRVLNFLEGPHGEAVADLGEPIVGGAPAGAGGHWRDRTIQQVPLALPGTWLFTAEKPITADDGRSGANVFGFDADLDDLDDDLSGDLAAEIVALDGKMTLFLDAGAQADDIDALVRRARTELSPMMGELVRLVALGPAASHPPLLLRPIAWVRGRLRRDQHEPVPDDDEKFTF